MIRYSLPLLLVATLLYAADVSKAPASKTTAKLQYNRDVRPILAENCFACHGADSAARKAKLRLDVREDAIEHGALVSGKASESELIARIMLNVGDDDIMPPAKSHKVLKPEQKEILKKWVEQGAEYEAHWAFIPPSNAPRDLRPMPKGTNDIDYFAWSAMAAHGLTPNPEAYRRTLARRLSLDLIGLPPEPADVEAFVNDKSDNWYEKYVDKLMAMPQWGEHRGRYWLDAARYADTHGIHFDNFREMYSYRDWVINAFNKNQPFDQFTIEQLAGDLLPNPTLDQQVATGFNRCNITTNEGGIIDEEYLVLYDRDRTETANVVWMGLTAGCAVCHDHKYDPVSQKEFYAMAAFFNNTTQGARDGNIHNTPPILTVPRMEDKAKWESLSKQAADIRARLASRKTEAKKDFTAWLRTAKASDAQAMIPTDEIFHLALDEGRGTEVIATVNGELEAATLTSGYEWVPQNPKQKQSAKVLAIKPGEGIGFAHAGDFAADQPFSVSAWVRTSKRGLSGSLVARMDESRGFKGWDLWAQGDRIGMHIVDSWSGKAIKVVTKKQLPPNQWIHVGVTVDGSRKAAGVRVYFNGNPEPVTVDNDSLGSKANTRVKVPFKIGQRTKGDRVQNVAIEDVRLHDRALSTREMEQLARAAKVANLLAKPADKRSAAENDTLFDWWLMSFDKAFHTLSASLDDLAREEVAIRGRGTIAHVSAEKPGMPHAYLLNRGEYDQRKDKLTAATPKSLPPFPAEFPKNRLGFAKWLLLREHPLTARVTVNRFWQQLFGAGLVRTTGDFGVAGELPSHPELLDWLALDFQRDWDVKRAFKQMVMSATYRQSAAVSPEKLEKDPANTWLSRGPRFRMDAEMVRDYALATSGLLVKKIGGPSVRPYQPDGVWEAVAMPDSNTRIYKRDTGDSLYRRSMYTFWKRAAPPASMEILNAPNRETCTVKRDRTNTPLQALLTLNDVQFVEAARVLAEKTIKSAADDTARIDYLAQKLLARSFRPEEMKVVQDSLAALVAEYKEKPDAAKMLVSYGESKADASLDVSTLAAWTMLANQMLNLDEVLNK